ncbi:MAG: hypothetical protein LC121_00970, partial [Anaerolineae bacterium]|nr:hypothetical protein [Anaerolineae bacterium]
MIARPVRAEARVGIIANVIATRPADNRAVREKNHPVDYQTINRWVMRRPTWRCYAGSNPLSGAARRWQSGRIPLRRNTGYGSKHAILEGVRRHRADAAQLHEV